MESVALIPAYKPEEAMLPFLQALREHFGVIVVVNDGSGDAYDALFNRARELGATVLDHAVNLGKGRALKTGLNHILHTYPDCGGVITADCDGQHAVEDILAVRGNTDTDADQALVRFPLWELCRVFPTGCGPFFFATHGHIYNSAHLPDGMQRGDILLQGHTHVPMTENHGSFLCFNPGSAGQPRYGSSPGYMTLEDGAFLWKTMDGTEYRRYEL